MAKVNETLFPSLEAEHQTFNEYDFFDYNRLTLQDVGADEYYMGRPVLSEVSEVTFDNDGVEQRKYRCQLFLVDDDAEEFLQINITLKEAGDVQHSLHYKSSAYKLIGGIMETLQKGWTQDHNIITQVNLSEYREFLNTKESMTIFIQEEQGTNFEYLTFKVTEVQ